MKTKGLYKRLSQCHKEEEIKHEFANLFGYKYDTNTNIDLYTPEILFEFKYDINMENVIERAKVIAQALYYIRKLKYGNTSKTPSKMICVVDKNEALFIASNQLEDFYLKTKSKSYDWDLQPSNPCKKLVTALANSDIIKELYVYHLSNPEGEKDFIKQHEFYKYQQLSLFDNKKEINENNFYDIFLYWQELFGDYVVNGHKSSEYFLTDIEQGRSMVINEVEVLFSMTSGEKISKPMPIPQYEHFWNTFSKVYDINELTSIRQKMDRMTEISLRRFTGEFFTPVPFAEKALDYIGRVFGSEWWKTGKYRLWDMACGTGNLEYMLPAKALRYCYLSTLLTDDIEYCKKLYPEATVFQYDYLNDDINILKHNELLNMGIKYKLPTQLVQDLNNSDIKWILLFNPPYVTSNNLQRNKKDINKNQVSMTEVQRLMHNEGLGEVSRELSSQFLYRINKEFNNKIAYISMFSKIKYINSNNDQKLRDSFFKYKYTKGFIFPSKSFQGCKESFPVGFLIWNLSQKIDLNKQKIIVDVYNEDIEKIGIKEIKSNNRDSFLSKWIIRENNTQVMPPVSSAIKIAYNNKDKRDRVSENFIASLMCKGNDFFNQNYTALFSSAYASAGGLSVTPNNFEQAMIVHTVRRLPKATWLNDRDQLMQPKIEVMADKEFISDCIIWSLFSDSNNATSLSNIKYEGKIYRIKNELFPYLSDTLKAWNITNPNIKTQAYSKHTERFVAIWLHEHMGDLSNEGITLMYAGEKLYKYFFENFMYLQWAKYQIYNWDVGWWQIKMALKNAGLGQTELNDVKEKHKLLGNNILNKIYAYGFIEPDMQEVNL